MKGFEGVVFYIFASLPKLLGARAVYYLSFSPEGRTLMSSARDRAPPTRHWRLQSRNSGGTIAGVAHQFLTCRGVQQLDDPISSCKP